MQSRDSRTSVFSVSWVHLLNADNGCRTFPGAFSAAYTNCFGNPGGNSLPYLNGRCGTYFYAGAAGNTVGFVYKGFLFLSDVLIHDSFLS